jgi:signal transduction histidine kinase
MNKATILLVDDDPRNLQMLLVQLSDSGYKLLIASNGEQALRQAKYVCPDLILLDIMMPGIDGFETCRRLKADNTTKNIPVIFITALTETVDKIKGFAVGGVDYITKPFQHEEVLARVNAHLTIQHQQQQLRELIASKDKFFSIIAHDLKGPLTVFQVYIELLAEHIDTYSKNQIKAFTQTLQETFNNFHGLLENLLTWSRLQRGMILFRPQPIEVQEFILRNITLCTPNAKQKQILLKSTIEARTKVLADKNMVDTVLRNLLSNALKFTHPGGEINVLTTQDTKDVTIAVSDTGIGIDGEHLSKLFQIDESCHTPGTAGEKGTGLGLILCKEFIEKNGGKIWAESEIGKGSSFKFTLPIYFEQSN